jgi:predicted small metal-binding protein
MALAYRCLDAGCDAEIRAADEGSLIAAVQTHMAEEHDSFELEDTIVDMAQPAEADQT